MGKFCDLHKNFNRKSTLSFFYPNFQDLCHFIPHWKIKRFFYIFSFSGWRLLSPCRSLSQYFKMYVLNVENSFLCSNKINFSMRSHQSIDQRRHSTNLLADLYTEHAHQPELKEKQKVIIVFRSEKIFQFLKAS